jgi:hypothetical protein
MGRVMKKNKNGTYFHTLASQGVNCCISVIHVVRDGEMVDDG